jgi:hypothetical protein
MNTKIWSIATMLCGLTSAAFADPTMSVIPLGLESGNWAWQINITPDLSLVPDSSGTPIAVELGFHLSSDPLLSVTNINTSQFDKSNPGAKIFGWEVTYVDDNNRPEGIEANCTGCTISNPIGGIDSHAATIVPGMTNEIFAALGSINFTTVGAKPFLKIVALGPGNGGPASSTLEWLGAYGTGSKNGRITQVTGLFGTTYTTSNFDIFSGSMTQSVPEPMSISLLGIGALAALCRRRIRPT